MIQLSDKLNNYNLMKMLCSKLSRKQIIEDLSIKCEELYLARESILKKDNEIEKLKRNWKNLRNYLEKERDSEIFEYLTIYNCIIDKMNELEGEDND